MKVYQLSTILLLVLITGCRNEQQQVDITDSGKEQYQVVNVENSVYKSNTIFKSSEDLSSPKFNHLI